MSLWFMSQSFNMPREGCFSVRLNGQKSGEPWHSGYDMSPPLRQESALLCLPAAGSTKAWKRCLYEHLEHFYQSRFTSKQSPIFPPLPHLAHSGQEGTFSPEDDKTKSFLSLCPLAGFHWLLIGSRCQHVLNRAMGVDLEKAFRSGVLENTWPVQLASSPLP